MVFPYLFVCRSEDDSDVPSNHDTYYISFRKDSQKPKSTRFYYENPNEDTFQVYSYKLKVFFDNPGYYEHRDILHDHGYLTKEVLLSERTPDGFVVVDDIVRVTVVRVNQSDQDFIFVVCEGTEVSVVAGCGIFIEELAKFGLISGRVVKLFNFVMGFLAVAVTLSTRDVTIVIEIGSSPVLFIMIIEANFSFMLI